MRSYQELLRHVLEYGELHDDRTGVGTLSVFGYQWRHDMRRGFPLLTVRRLALRWIVEELRWFIRGSADELSLRQQGVDIWQEWATAEACARFGRQEGHLGPIYGPMLRAFPIGVSPHDIELPLACETVDQLAWLVRQIRENPASRRLVVSYWHPYYQRRVALPPCHTLWQVKCHSDKIGLSLHLYCRSIDSFLGWPYDVASYAMLLTLLARATGREPRHLVLSFGDLHVYNNHLDQCATVLGRDSRPLPTLELDSALGDDGLQTLLDFEWRHVRLLDYNPHPPVKADVAV